MSVKGTSKRDIISTKIGLNFLPVMSVGVVSGEGMAAVLV